MKSLFSFLIIIVTLYVIALFTVTESVRKVTDPLGFKQVNETILGIKSVNTTISNLETTGGILDGYENIIGDARSAVNKIASGTMDVKEKIDGVRSTLSGAESTVNEVITTGNNVIKKVDEVKQSLNDVQKIGQSIQEIVNTGAIQ